MSHIYIKSRLIEPARKVAKFMVLMGSIFIPFDIYFLVAEFTIVGDVFFLAFMSLMAYPFYRYDNSVCISDVLYRSEFTLIWKHKHEQSIKGWQVLYIRRSNVIRDSLQRRLRKPKYMTSVFFGKQHKDVPYDVTPVPEIYFEDDDNPEDVVTMIKAIADATGFDVVFNDEALAKWYPTYQKLHGDVEYKFANYKSLLLA